MKPQEIMMFAKPLKYDSTFFLVHILVLKQQLLILIVVQEFSFSLLHMRLTQNGARAEFFTSPANILNIFLAKLSSLNYLGKGVMGRLNI